MSPITQTSIDPHPIFSFADGEMGVFSNAIIRFVEQITGQPHVEKLYFDYVSDNLNPQFFWSDALDRLRIELQRPSQLNSASNLGASHHFIACLKKKH